MPILRDPLRVSKLGALSLSLLLGSLTGQAATLPAGFAETKIAEGLNPTTMTFAPDGRLFLCEKHGLLRIISGEQLQEEPFLDISDQVDSWNERGLLSVCFDPDFERNNWLYIYYTHNRDPKDTSHRSSNNRVSRFTAKGNKVVPNSESVLLELNDLSKIGWHNGGGLAFGKDGKLYVSTGENADGPNAQKTDNLLGKLLRLNKDGSIPSDNPHYRKLKGNNRAIVALGLRNPYKIVAEPQSGQLLLSEVGANFEQIEHYDSASPPQAANYGWPKIDGPRNEQSKPDHYRDPLHAYDHGGGKATALCGGDFYRPTTPGADAFPPEFTASYLFCDYGGWIKRIDPANPEPAQDFATDINRPIDLATAPDGALHYIERAGIPGGSDAANTASKNGSLWRVRWTGGGQATQLAFLREPHHSHPGMPIGEIQVALQDATGQTINSARVQVTLSLAKHPNAPQIHGTTTVAAINGVATFPSLTINQPGRSYSLLAKCEGLREISSTPFDIDQQVAPPTISPPEGTYSGPVWLQITSKTPGASIHYTSDGSKPDQTSPRYTGPFKLNASETITALARKNGLHDSASAKATLSITGALPYGLDYRPPVTGINLPATAEESLPATLSATGIFTDRNLTPRPGIIPYTLNSSVWADGAEVQRWVILPGSAKINFTPSGEYSWPGGTTFVQHFELVTNKSTDSRRRLETRVLVLDAAGTFGYGATYRWRKDNRDADLVDAAGQEEQLKVIDASGTTREQTWSYPGRGTCYLCHTPNAGFVLGPKTHQLNGNFTYSRDRTDNQLRTWNYLQMFTPGLEETAISTYPEACKIDDSKAPLEKRIHSYLDANCSNCHRPGGTGALWDARFETPFDKQNIFNIDVRNTFGIDGAKLVVPGDPAKSIMHLRLGATEPEKRMPPVTRNVPDPTALEAFRQWTLSAVPPKQVEGPKP